ncbi:hypothetical protein [Sphingobacterium faecium]|uniref:hypothetical protein n=1 Tax=Sphingobacterium faecium TaxID=34087 RepID=UPI00247A212E|nr:hypothetical protein [Sphingobacterium faecium]WGQ15610.1 hypothetical protein QG727_04190 [Sphingobacterium faecium]
MLSKKDGWSFSAERIALDNTDGREAVRSGLRELEKSGYLKRLKINDGKGYFEIEYHLFYPEVVKTDVVQSDAVKPDAVKPVVGKPVINSNTNYSNTNSNKKNSNNFSADAEQKKIEDDFLVQDYVKTVKEKKEKSSAEKEKEPKKISKDDFRQTLINNGADAQHVADWFVVRDSHKAPYTLTALNKFLNECQNNNYPVSLAVQACAEYNWRGFEYQWILNKQKYVTGQTTAVTKPTASQDRQERIDSVKRMGDLARQIVANAINNG